MATFDAKSSSSQSSGSSRRDLKVTPFMRVKNNNPWVRLQLERLFINKPNLIEAGINTVLWAVTLKIVISEPSGQKTAIPGLNYLREAHQKKCDSCTVYWLDYCCLFPGIARLADLGLGLRTDDGDVRPKDLWEPVVYREEQWGWGLGSRPAQKSSRGQYRTTFWALF